MIISTAANVGGMERIVCGLHRLVKARGLAVETIFPNPRDRTFFRNWCVQLGCEPEFNTNIVNASDEHTYGKLFSLAQFVKTRNPSIVNIHYGDNFASLKDVLALRLSGRRGVTLTIHHPTEWDTANRRKRIATWAACQLADAIVVVSNATRSVLSRAGVASHKIHVIPNGVPVQTSILSKQEARKRLGINCSGFVVGELGRLVHHKGIRDLIEATTMLSATISDLTVVVAGDGPERADLERLASERIPGRVVFLGRISDPAYLYAAADIFVLPSKLEGFGVVYLEAALHGRASVGCSVGGVPEVILNEETGLLVPPESPREIAAAVRRLYANPIWCQNLGLAARRRAARVFNEEVMGARYHDLMSEVVRRRCKVDWNNYSGSHES